MLVWVALRNKDKVSLEPKDDDCDDTTTEQRTNTSNDWELVQEIESHEIRWKSEPKKKSEEKVNKCI